MKRTYHAILFDFDYTLADSSRAVVECVHVAFRGLGLALPKEIDIRRTIGLSLPETLVKLAGEAERPRAEEFRRLFRQRSDEIMVAWTEIYPYVGKAVTALREQGFRTGIVSTKFRHRIEAVLRREGLAQLFEVVVGGEDVPAFKPDPSGLLRALAALDAAPSNALYLGDSLTDAETARRAGVAFVAVLSGETAVAEFDGYEPLAALRNVGEVAEWLERWEG